jgi:hypothetical protein
MPQKRIMRISSIVAAIVVSLLLTSCFGIAMETVFNSDGSGRLIMKLRIAQFLLEMGEEEAGVGIPLSKDDLTAEYEDLDGVTIVEVTEEDIDEDRVITAVIDFENFNNLASDEEFPGEEASLTIKDGKSTFRILVGQPRGDDEESTDEEFASTPEEEASMTAMLQSFMEGYSVEYRILAPKKIESFSAGEVDKDGRTFVYTLPMGDFIAIEEPFYVEVVW